MNQENTNNTVLVMEADTGKRTTSRNNSPIYIGNYAVPKSSTESVNDREKVKITGFRGAWVASRLSVRLLVLAQVVILGL